MYSTIYQSFISFLLKFFSYLHSFVGVSIFLYSIWMLNDWNRHDLDKSSAPWFVYAVMAVGVLMCLIAFMGHIAAGVVNGCCLCSYMVFTLMIILLEATVMADLIFNKHWEEDLPHDATGHLRSLRAFIEANMDIVKWIAVTLVVVQALSFLLAIILRAMVPPKRAEDESDEDFTAALSFLLAIILRAMVPPKRAEDESDEDFTAVRQPLINPHGNLASASVDNTMIQSDSWSSRMRQKYGLVPGPP